MEVFSYLNSNPPVVIALVGLAAVMVQYLVRTVFKLDEAKLTNYVLAIGAIPGFLTGLVAVGTSLHLNAYPWVVIASQAIYAGYEKLKSNAEKRAVAKLSVPTAEPTTTSELTETEPNQPETPLPIG